MSGLAVLCPGQGGQHPALLERALGDPRGAAAIARAGAALGRDLAALASAPGADLFANEVAQPLVCAAGAATWEALRERVPAPLVVLGYSLGELTAYAVAGALAIEDAVSLASRRAAAMSAASPPGSGLVALRGAPLGRLEELARESGAEVAIVNGPDHCIAGGASGPLVALERAALLAGVPTVQRLPVTIPAHTSLLAAAVEPFAAALEGSPLRDPAVPVLAGVSALPVRRRGDAVAALSAQLARRIEWERCLATAAELGCGVFLEVGPGSALAHMASEVIPGCDARSVEDFRSLDGAARWVATALARR